MKSQIYWKPLKQLNPFYDKSRFRRAYCSSATIKIIINALNNSDVHISHEIVACSILVLFQSYFSSVRIFMVFSLNHNNFLLYGNIYPKNRDTSGSSSTILSRMLSHVHRTGPCACACVRIWAITLMIIYDREHKRVPGRNWFVYSRRRSSRDPPRRSAPHCTRVAATCSSLLHLFHLGFLHLLYRYSCLF